MMMPNQSDAVSIDPKYSMEEPTHTERVHISKDVEKPHPDVDTGVLGIALPCDVYFSEHGFNRQP